MLQFLFIFILTRFIIIDSEAQYRTIEAEHKRLDCAIKPGEYPNRFEVKIYLCTRKHDHCSLVSGPSMAYKTMESNGFDLLQNTTVLVHGFQENFKRKWLRQMKKFLLQREPMNVLLVDWSSLWTPNSTKEYLKAFLRSLNYRGAVISTPHVAHEISRFFHDASKISKVSMTKWGKIHFIGHSLGAHIAGQAARKLKKTVHVHRITGLDPANPCFESSKSQLRLNRFDAKVVDVIHTNSDPKDRANFGIYYPLGTLDFYPNGGNNQPGCSKLKNPEELVKNPSKNSTRDIFSISAKILNRFQRQLFGTPIDFEDIILKTLSEGSSISCNHGKASEYFIRSLDKDQSKMLATPMDLDQFSINKNVQCQNRNCTGETCVAMGIDADLYESARGTYYIDMSDSPIECDLLLSSRD